MRTIAELPAAGRAEHRAGRTAAAISEADPTQPARYGFAAPAAHVTAFTSSVLNAG